MADFWATGQRIIEECWVRNIAIEVGYSPDMDACISFQVPSNSVGLPGVTPSYVEAEGKHIISVRKNGDVVIEMPLEEDGTRIQVIEAVWLLAEDQLYVQGVIGTAQGKDL